MVSGTYAGDTIANMTAAVNANSALTAIGVSAAAADNVMTLVVRPSYSVSTSAGATENITLGNTIECNVARL